MSNDAPILPRFKCPSCQAKMKADPELSGQEVECPRCGEAVTIPVVSFKINDKISGFVIESWIGSGAMGEVYQARQLSMDRPVALKLLRTDLTEDAESVERFNNEVRLLASLDHPNIVTAFEAGRYKGFYFLAMSFVRGYNLDECLMERGKLPEKETLKVVLKVANALSYAWDRHKLLHRDIKPSNIMIDADGEVKLTDMGISVRIGERFEGIEGGFAIGTPYYMSPEQASGLTDLDFRADMFSLGTSLFHLVTGKPPFDGKTPTDIMLKVINDPLPDPRSINPELSAACCKVIRKMMAKEKDKRYASWDDCINDLQKAIRGRKSTAAPSTDSSPKKKKLKKSANAAVNRRLANLEAASTTPASRGRWLVPTVATLIGLALIGFVIYQLTRDETPPPAAAPPRPQPVAATDESPATGEDARLKALDKLYREAEAFEEQHPDDIRAIRQRYEFIRNQGARTRYEMMAEDALNHLSKRRESDIRQARQMIEIEVERLVGQRQFNAALDYLQSYEGAHKQETMAYRQRLIDGLKRRLSSSQEKNQQRKNQARMELTSLLDVVAGHLIRKDYDAANQQLMEALGAPDFRPVRQEIAATHTVTEHIGGWPDAVRRTYAEDVGKEIEVLTRKDGKLTIRVREVDGSRIKAFREMPNGRIGVNLSLSDLQPEEFLNRLQRWESPSRPLAMGLLSLWSRQGEPALAHFAELPDKLSNALFRQAHVLLPEPVETAARVKLMAQLESWHLTTDNPHQTIADLEARHPPEAQRQQMRQYADAFVEQFGFTTVAVKWQPVLQYLQGINVATWPVNRQQVTFLWLNARTPEQNEVLDPESDRWVRCHPLAEGDARMSDEGFMQFTQPGSRFVSSEAADRIIQACRATHAFALECVIRPASLEQTGPARIVTCSSDSNSRNFTLGQDGKQLVLRLRTPMTGLNGTRPEMRFGDLSSVDLPCHVVVSYRDGELRAWLNGTLAAETNEIKGSFDNWTSQPLIFGNEASGDRQWLGSLHRIGIYARTIPPAEAKQLYELYRAAGSH